MRTPAGSGLPAGEPPTDHPPRRDPGALARREVGTLMLAWTMAVVGWLAIEVLESDIRTLALRRE